MGLGAFIGCSPFYGFHLLICWVAGWFLGLNRLKMYLASNVSNPLVAPFLVVAEIQTGAWLRRGPLHTFGPAAVDWLTIGADLLIGSVIVGAAVGASTAAVTYATLHRSLVDDRFMAIARPASDRYVGDSITAWEFARGKLAGDSVYRQTLAAGLLHSGGTLLDVGCGQGLMLSLLIEARRTFDAGGWPPAWPEPPRFERLIGVELRRRAARLAERALDGGAQIVQADVSDYPVAECDAILLFDVLHMMPADRQDALIVSAAARLRPGGVLLVREADASAGRRFHAVLAGNRIKALVSGAWRLRFHFRSTNEWLAAFARAGLDAAVVPTGDGRPHANVLFRAVKRDAGPGVGPIVGSAFRRTVSE